MQSLDVIPVGQVAGATSSSHVVRIVHISDTHLGHHVLTPPRPISGNISIRRSNSSDVPNQVVDEKGIDAFEKKSGCLAETSDGGFHKGGVFLSNVRRSRASDYEIPCGDILVHSGDFDWSKHSGRIFRSDNFEEIVQLMNDFFDRFPHKVKIFVAGNHEGCLEKRKIQAVQDRLTSAVYLYNSTYIYEGIHFYGSPYTPFRFMTNARGFIRTSRKIAAHWREIPSRTDVLVTHSPPHGILDLGVTWSARNMPGVSQAFHRVIPSHPCETCGIIHPGRSHWGCPHLREEVLIRIKPTLHLFGHVHEGNGVLTRKGITFSNSSYASMKRPHVFDFYTGF
ncbi:unnamed protein product [Candidula unifasciata]|uniref:Calcineurin-like phosphoesterase domain-containing protein n=1 Tax=Candidula unifasciata TaxID=100452 RepID=A0A8S3ZQC2_9EUPU|nr:unnamed protein product [Candidula unifasciata]